PKRKRGPNRAWRPTSRIPRWRFGWCISEGSSGHVPSLALRVSVMQMTIPYRKKLIEVALPLAKINEAAAREKSIRHGHPSTLHLWWARRPLAACRAVLFASLVDDPDSDPAYRRPDGSVAEQPCSFTR